MSDGERSTVFRENRLVPGLYLVATPIGSARDITLRALDILASADVIAAEDTRVTRRLMELHGVPVKGRQMIPYHDHNGKVQRPKLLAMIADGKSIAYASDAGTPMVADPGFALARAVRDEGYNVTAAPGASAVLTALTIGGLPTDRFLFAGFVPNSKGARLRFLQDLQGVKATSVVFESPNRVAACLKAIEEVFGEKHQMALCRELTKKFETVLQGTVASVLEAVEAKAPKGEIVLLIDRAEEEKATPEMLDEALMEALRSQSLKEAATTLAERFKMKRRDVYQRGLALRQED